MRATDLVEDLALDGWCRQAAKFGDEGPHGAASPEVAILATWAAR